MRGARAPGRRRRRRGAAKGLREAGEACQLLSQRERAGGRRCDVRAATEIRNGRRTAAAAARREVAHAPALP
jgi:hypothetical protein